MSAQPEIVENRSYPRVECRQSLRLSADSGTGFDATLADVSPDGLQAVCARSDAISILTDNAKHPTDNHARIRVNFDIPGPSGALTITVDCRLIHSSPTEDNQITFGLKFVQFLGDSRAHLGKFLINAMEHA